MTYGKHKKPETFPPGPWDKELFDWGVWVDELSGLQCAIRRNGSGAWCGYVILPPEHPINRRNFSGEDRHMDLTSGDPVWLEVHGGVTFHGRFAHPEIGVTGTAVGFDCAHFGDCVPVYGARQEGEYKTAEFAMSEVRLLASQIAEYSRLEQLVSCTNLEEL